MTVVNATVTATHHAKGILLEHVPKAFTGMVVDTYPVPALSR